MHTLSNAELTVMVLDPVEDVARLGSRYCSGGYIWQVSDKRLGEVFAGPQYPEEPNTFDGQGAPEMFTQALGAEKAPVGGEVECIGVGRVRRTSPREPFHVRDNPEVITRVRWSVDRTDESITMRAEHGFRNWAYGITRKVALHGRTFCSRTTVRNLGEALLPIRWFAHPFFPLVEDRVLCRFSFPAGVPENPGFARDSHGYVVRKPEHDWRRGCFQALEAEPAGRPLTAVQRHPRFGLVTVQTDFVPAYLPVWGNHRTFSFEPYFDQTLKSGEEAAWGIQYFCGKGREEQPENEPNLSNIEYYS